MRIKAPGEDEFRPLADPNGCPGMYHFDAYCRFENPDHDYQEFPHTPHGAHTLGQAKSQLRSQGWRFHRDGTATCPKCARRLREKDNHEGGDNGR